MEDPFLKDREVTYIKSCGSGKHSIGPNVFVFQDDGNRRQGKCEKCEFVIGWGSRFDE